MHAGKLNVHRRTYNRSIRPDKMSKVIIFGGFLLRIRKLDKENYYDRLLPGLFVFKEEIV